MRERLGVLYLIETTDPGGAEIALLNLAAGLDRQAFRPVVGLLREGWLSQQLRARGVEVVVLPSGGRGPVDLALLRGIAALARAQRAAVVHSFMFYMNIYGTLGGRLAGKPVIIGVRGKGYDFSRTRNIIAYRVAARLCTRMTVVSAEMAEFVRPLTGVARAKLLIIPNGVDAERFRPAPQWRGQTRAEYGIPPHAPLIGTVGRLEPVKGQADLVRALAELGDMSQAHLLIVGEGSQRSELEMLAKELGVAGRVHLPGFREDVEKVLPALDVFALPSHSEGMPNALLQAMAAGLPAVATDVGGTGEVLDAGVTGLLVTAGDCYALAASLRRLLTDQELARRMGEAARARVVERYSQQAFIQRHETLYREVTCAR